MKVQKRNGEIVPFDLEKISIAISGAFEELGKTFEDIKILDNIEDIALKESNPIDIEDIQDMVEEELMRNGYYEEAKCFITYRYKHKLIREFNTTDKAIKELLNGESEYWNTENSNKNAKWVTTQRDYLAGITSKDIACRFILPKEVVDAHNKGAIHIHDMDYMAQNTLSNCCLVNLDDMLQNGTVINGVSIESPHRIITATTIATQIIAAVASSQYGGVSISLAHLAPFVRKSYEQHLYKYLDNGCGSLFAEEFAEMDTKKEVADAVQTLNYQLNSLTTTNG